MLLSETDLSLKNDMIHFRIRKASPLLSGDGYKCCCERQTVKNSIKTITGGKVSWEEEIETVSEKSGSLC